MREQISRLMDGDLDDAEVDARLPRAEAARRRRVTWVCYHVIGDALRGDPARRRAGFAARFAARLAAEPTVLAPQAARSRPAAARLGGRRDASRRSPSSAGSPSARSIRSRRRSPRRARPTSSARRRSRPQPVSAGLPARAPGVLADHADPGRRARTCARSSAGGADGRP